MLRLILVFTLSLGLCSPPAALAQPDADPLLVGVFPRRNPQATREMFSPLIEYLSEQLQRPVRLETTYDFASFWDALQDKRYSLVHYNQYHYIRSHAEQGYRVIAQNEEVGYDKIASAIIVRKDSGLESLEDLRGRKVVFGGGRKAMIAYIGATYLLRQAGLDEGEYFEQFALTPMKATVATYYRQAAATGAGFHMLQLPIVANQIDADAMRYLAVGETHAHLPWAVAEHLDPRTIEKLRALLVGLGKSEQERQLLRGAGLTGINPASNADYDPYRRIIKTVTGEDYLND